MWLQKKKSIVNIPVYATGSLINIDLKKSSESISDQNI